MGLHLSKSTTKDERPIEIRCTVQDLASETSDSSPDLVHCSAHGVPKFIKLSDLEARQVGLILKVLCYVKLCRPYLLVHIPTFAHHKKRNNSLQVFGARLRLDKC